jgi:hypothetical protein
MAKSLSTCLGKAGDLLADDIKARIIARATELRDGGASLSAAAKRAVQEVAGDINTQRTEVEAAFNEGRTLYAEAPAWADDAETGEGSTPLDRMAQETPDRLVTLPGEDQPIRMADALERIKADEADEAFTAELVKVAGECALTFG